MKKYDNMYPLKEASMRESNHDLSPVNQPKDKVESGFKIENIEEISDIQYKE